MSVKQSPFRRGSLPDFVESPCASNIHPRFVILKVRDSFMPGKMELGDVETKTALFRELAFQLPTKVITQIVEEVNNFRLEQNVATDSNSDQNDFQFSESWCTQLRMPSPDEIVDSSKSRQTSLVNVETSVQNVVLDQTLATGCVKNSTTPKSTSFRLSDVPAESCHTSADDQNSSLPTTSGRGDRDSQKELRRRRMSSEPSQNSLNSGGQLSDMSAHMLIRQVFPQEILTLLASGGCEDISDAHPSVSVFFSDIVGFTEWCSTVTPKVVCECLSSIFQIIDDLAEQFNVYKVETIGDCWMGVCGAPKALHNHEEQMANFAVKVKNMVPEIRIICNDEKLSLRCGVHCGPVVSGVVRADRPRWQLFGDTVNTASRMESTSLPGRCQVSSQMATRLQSSATNFLLEDRGLMQVKGKGEVQTFFLNGVEKSDAHSEMVQHLSVLKIQEPSGGLQLRTSVRKTSENLPRHPRSREGSPKMASTRYLRRGRCCTSLDASQMMIRTALSLPGSPNNADACANSFFDPADDTPFSPADPFSAPCSPFAPIEDMQCEEGQSSLNPFIGPEEEATTAWSNSEPTSKEMVVKDGLPIAHFRSRSRSSRHSYRTSHPKRSSISDRAELSVTQQHLLDNFEGKACGVASLSEYNNGPDRQDVPAPDSISFHVTKSMHQSNSQIDFHDLGGYAQGEVVDNKDTVLLVDDQISVLLQYQRFLRKIPGIKVAIAKNGVQALERMIPAQYSVVFMDVNMPEMDGREAIAAFRQWESEIGRTERQRVVCLFHTTSYSADEVQGLLDLGFDAVECKSHYKNKLLKHMEANKLLRPDGRKSSMFGKNKRLNMELMDPILAEAYSLIRSFTGNRHILVVDASQPVRRLYERRLLRLGMVVHTACNAKQALVAMQSQQYLIVFMDLNLPNMTGEECVQAQRKWEMESSNAPQYIVAFFTSREEKTRHEEICSLLSVGFDEAEFKGDSKKSFAMFLAKHMGL